MNNIHFSANIHCFNEFLHKKSAPIFTLGADFLYDLHSFTTAFLVKLQKKTVQMLLY